MGQVFSPFHQKRGIFSDTDRSVESSVRSIQSSNSFSSSSGSVVNSSTRALNLGSVMDSSKRSALNSLQGTTGVMDRSSSTRVLNLESKFLVCSSNTSSVMEDPNGYSSRVYYRSNVNVGEGVPFQWEAQPGKPKNGSLQEGFNIVPLSPPPSFEVEKRLRSKQKKHRNRKSRKNHGPCLVCTCCPFSIKSGWS